MTDPTSDRDLLARTLHDADCRWGIECRDDPQTWARYYRDADAILARHPCASVEKP